MPEQLATLDRGPTAGDASVARTLHTAAVVTPEAVLLEFRAAGIASRLLAKGIDLIIQLIAFYAVVIMGALLAAVNGTLGLIVIVVSVFLVVFGYPAMEAVWNGQTPGKKVFGIRVITIEGGPVRFRHAAIRSMVWMVEFLLPPGGLFALASALLTRRSQRIGDLAAGTVVIRSNTVKPSPIFFAPAMGAEHFSATFDAGRIEPQHYALIREFLVRAHDLTPEARRHVAEQLADGLATVSQKPKPPDLDAERFVVAAVFAYQRRFAPDSEASTASPTGPPAAPPTAPPSAPPPRVA